MLQLTIDSSLSNSITSLRVPYGTSSGGPELFRPHNLGRYPETPFVSRITTRAQGSSKTHNRRTFLTMTMRLLSKFRGLRGCSECSSVHSGRSVGSGTSLWSKQTAAETVVPSPRQTKVRFKSDENNSIHEEVFLFQVDDGEDGSTSSGTLPDPQVDVDAEGRNRTHTDADDFLENEEDLVQELKQVFECCSSPLIDDQKTSELVEFMVRWSNSAGRGLETCLLNPTRLQGVRDHAKSILQLQGDCKKGALRGQVNVPHLLRKRSRKMTKSTGLFSYLVATGDSMCHKEFEI